MQKIDATPLEHALGALIMVGVWYGMGDSTVGACGAIMAFLGREHAQAEQRCIQNYYYNRRDLAPWYCGLEPRAWDKGSVLDVLAPILAVLIWLAIEKSMCIVDN